MVIRRGTLWETVQSVNDLLERIRSHEERLALLWEEELDEANVLPVFDSLEKFLVGEMLRSLRQEEITIFPPAAELAEGAGTVARLGKEHKDLRHELGHFLTALTSAYGGVPGTRITLFMQLIDDASRLLAHLKAHLEFESEVVVKLTSAATPPSQMAALAVPVPSS